MLFACKNDIKKVSRITDKEVVPAMSGEQLAMTYSDSARVKYRMFAPLYTKIKTEEEDYDEFPGGIHVIYYDRDGSIIGEIQSEYAKNLTKEELWEARRKVVVRNGEGKKLETELLYWDMRKKWIYSDQFARLTDGNNVLESSGGFESDQNLEHPVFKNITDGEVKFNMEAMR